MIATVWLWVSLCGKRWGSSARSVLCGVSPVVRARGVSGCICEEFVELFCSLRDPSLVIFTSFLSE